MMQKSSSNQSRSQSDYYQATDDWAYCMYQSQTVWLRRVSIALLITAILLALSLLSSLYLFPLKEKVPYLYAFDHTTGEVSKIGTLESSVLSSNWAVSRYMLIQYVINRESYHAENIEHPYQLIWAQSSDEVKKQYESETASSNANSPYHLYGKDKFVTANVTAVSRLNENTVDIKFEKVLHDRASGMDQTIHKEAIIKWEFSHAETTQKMLDRDLLGFKVNYYEVNQVNLENNL